MKIRKINISFLNQVLEISKQQFGQESWTEQQFNDALTNNNYNCYGIVFENKLVSYCLVLESVDDLNILSVATHSDYKNNGHATRLIEYVINQGKTVNKTISLEVKETNQIAINLYTKLNFKVITKRKNYYKDGNTACIMFYQE